MCNVYPFEPNVYIAKLGYTGVNLFFLLLLQNLDCGYSLEPPPGGGSNVYPQSIFRAKIRKNIKKKISAEIFQFLKLKKSQFIAWACFRNGYHLCNKDNFCLTHIRLTPFEVLSIPSLK